MNSKPYVYQEKCEFTYSARDINDNPLPQAVLREFQDLAGWHAEELGVGYQALKDKGLIWVVVKERYKVLKPLPLTELKSVTWPHPKRILEINRDYEILDKDDTPLIIGTSKWCIVNINTRKLFMGNISYPEGTYLDKKTFDDDYKVLKPVDLSSLTPNLTHKVMFSELDHNRHFNNTFYANLAINAIPNMVDYAIDDIQINFLKEVGLGETLKVYVIKGEKEEEFQVIGQKESGELSFNSYLKLKHI